MNALQREALAIVPQRETNCEVIRQVHRNGRTVFVIRNGVQSTYLRCSSNLYELFRLMDGKTSLKEIVKTVFESPERIDIEIVLRFVAALHRKSMIHLGSDSERAALDECHVDSSGRPNGIFSLSARGVKSIRTKWCLMNCDKYVTRLYERAGKLLFKRLSLQLLSVISVFGLVLFVLQLTMSEFSVKELLKFNGSYLFGIPVLYSGILIVTILHEFGHALTCKHFGRRVDAMGIMLYWGAPVFYTDVTDSWMLTRMKRTAVAIAGIVVNLLVGGLLSIATLVSSSTEVVALCLTGAFLNYFAILLNLVPFLKYDGYYVISDLLDKPNLREESIEMVFNISCWNEFLRGNPGSASRRSTFVFGLLSCFYGGFALCFVLKAIQSWLYQNLPRPFSTFVTVIVLAAVFILTAALLSEKIRASRKSI